MRTPAKQIHKAPSEPTTRTMPAIPEGLDERAWRSVARPRGDNWLIDERDDTGTVVGTAMRKPNGEKTSKTGSKRGLIVPDGELAAYAGSSSEDPILIAEGATDTAALFGLGFDAIGVPMAGHCAGWLASMLADRHAVIVADADKAGRDGAMTIARAIADRVASVRITEPPGGHKDARAAVIAGATREDFEAVIAAARSYNDEPEDERDQPDPPARFVPFPTEALPAPFADFVQDAAAAMGCDESFVALPLLSAMAAAIGNSHKIQIKPGWEAPCIVWSAIIGESGTMKSPALAQAVAAVRERQRRAMREHEQILKDYEAELAAWKQSNDRDDDDTEPTKPTCPRTWTEDSTTEGLVVLLRDNPRGLLMVRDELAGWFDLDRYSGGRGGGDSAKWLQMFEGRELIVDRKSSGNEFVPRAAVSIAGGIQPGILRRVLGREHRESGLAARILFAMPPRKPKRWTDQGIDEAKQAAVAACIEKLYELPSGVDERTGEATPHIVRLDSAARRRFARFVDEHGIEQASRVGDEAAAWAKLEGYAARFALIFHLAREAAGDPSIGDPFTIGVESVEAGIALVRWFANETERVYGLLSAEDEDQERDQLTEWIAARGGAVTARELGKGPRMYRGEGKAESALKELARAGIVRVSSNGRTDVFTLNTGGTGGGGTCAAGGIANAGSAAAPSGNPPARHRKRG